MDKGTGAAFLRDVVRRQWKDAITGTDKTKCHATAQEIDVHIANMNALIDPLDYEIFCVPNIVSYSKHMQSEEFTRYLQHLEALAAGYSSMLGRDITGLVMIGMTSKARTVKSVERYHKMLYDEIDAKFIGYNTIIQKKKEHIDRLSLRVTKHRRSILGFFRRGKIRVLSSRIEHGKRKVDRLSKKLETLEGVKKAMKVSSGPSQPKPPK